MAAELVHGTDVMSQLLGAPVEDYKDLASQLHDGDEKAANLHFALMTQMRTSFINPLPREDLYALSRLLGEAVEKLDGAAELIALHKLAHLSKRATEQLEVINRQALLSVDAMTRLSSLEDLEEYWIEMLRLSRRAARTHRIWVSELQRDHKAVAYARHRDVANQLMDVVNDLRRLATHVGSILVKES
nr:nuclease PIN [Arthrobacter roseus]